MLTKGGFFHLIPSWAALARKEIEMSEICYCNEGALMPWGGPESGWYILYGNEEDPAPEGPFASYEAAQQRMESDAAELQARQEDDLLKLNDMRFTLGL